MSPIVLDKSDCSESHLLHPMLNLLRKQNWAVLKVKKTPVFQLTDLQKQIIKQRKRENGKKRELKK